MTTHQGPFVLLRLVSRKWNPSPHEIYVLPELTDREYQALRKAEGMNWDDAYALLGEDDERNKQGEAYVLVSYYLGEYEKDDCEDMDLYEPFRDECRKVYEQWDSYRRDSSLLAVNEEYGGSIKAVFTIDNSQ